ncbi:Two-component response regulator ARR11 [Linum grandiflorum]
MKGVKHGASDYLLKPIRMMKLRNIWQHFLRKRIHERRQNLQIFLLQGGLQYAHLFFCGGDDLSLMKRRKDQYDDKVGPKKILDLMNVPWLTRENVSSHMQVCFLNITKIHALARKPSLA